MEKYVLSGGEDSELTAEGWKRFPRWRRGGGDGVKELGVHERIWHFQGSVRRLKWWRAKAKNREMRLGN